MCAETATASFAPLTLVGHASNPKSPAACPKKQEDLPQKTPRDAGKSWNGTYPSISGDKFSPTFPFLLYSSFAASPCVPCGKILAAIAADISDHVRGTASARLTQPRRRASKRQDAKEPGRPTTSASPRTGPPPKAAGRPAVSRAAPPPTSTVVLEQRWGGFQPQFLGHFAGRTPRPRRDSPAPKPVRKVLLRRDTPRPRAGPPKFILTPLPGRSPSGTILGCPTAFATAFSATAFL